MVTKSIIPLSVFGSGIDRYVSPGYGLLLHLLNQYLNAGAVGCMCISLRPMAGHPREDLQLDVLEYMDLLK